MTLPLTPSVALPLSGLWDLTPTESGSTRTDSTRRLVKDSALPRSRALCDQFDPRAQPRIALNPVDACVPRGWGLTGRRNQWHDLPCGCHANRASAGQDQIGFRRTGDHPSSRPVRAALTGLYPDPLRSDTFCRELVGVPAGEANTSGRLRTLSEPTGDLKGIRQSRSTPPLPSTGLLSRSPLRPALLAQAVLLQGPPLAFPRDGDCDPRSPRCLPFWGTTPGG
jgi:hypothetical protein